MSTTVEEAWSPEPELRVPPPRRLRPSEYPDLNSANVTNFMIIGVVGLVAGIALIVMGVTGNVLLLILGILLAIGGGAALLLPRKQAANFQERAERLVREGQPVMARIVTADNMTGSSTYGRTVSYMVTIPGGEVMRREVNADERALPKRIPANVTALMDMRTNDVELYCALPFRAVAPPEAAPDPMADLPMNSAAGEGSQMGKMEPDKPAAPPPGQSQEQGKSTYQGLPWE